ncbi:MAG: hypothetical protein JWQ21_1897 [Herminiimonas sp.]|nr:hypothetical protein [Herminiimonas sp.]
MLLVLVAFQEFTAPYITLFIGWMAGIFAGYIYAKPKPKVKCPLCNHKVRHTGLSDHLRDRH